MATTNLYERDGWKVIESRENVPAGRYEVRNPDGRRFGIWESVESAVRHLHEVKDSPPQAMDLDTPEGLAIYFGDAD